MDQIQRNKAVAHARAQFVPIDEFQNKDNFEKFKYFWDNIGKKFDLWKLNCKRFTNTQLDKLKYVLVAHIGWRKVCRDIGIWTITVFVEGLTANFATNQLFQIELNLGMILAHGIAIYQTIDIINRLKSKEEKAHG